MSWQQFPQEVFDVPEEIQACLDDGTLEDVSHTEEVPAFMAAIPQGLQTVLGYQPPNLARNLLLRIDTIEEDERCITPNGERFVFSFLDACGNSIEDHVATDCIEETLDCLRTVLNFKGSN